MINKSSQDPTLDNKYTLEEGGTSVTVTVNQIEGKDLYSVYFDEYNMSGLINNNSRGKNGIEKYARFYLKVKKSRETLSLDKLDGSKIKGIIEKFSGTVIGGTGLVGIIKGINNEDWVLGVLGVAITYLGGEIINDGEFREFISYFERTYPEYFGKKPQKSLSYIGAEDSLISPGIQKLILSIISIKNGVQEVISNEIEYGKTLSKKLGKHFN